MHLHEVGFDRAIEDERVPQPSWPQLRSDSCS